MSTNRSLVFANDKMPKAEEMGITPEVMAGMTYGELLIEMGWLIEGTWRDADPPLLPNGRQSEGNEG